MVATTCKCNLIIPGFGKSGTSSLHEYLASHPDICMSDPKEPGFFALASEWQEGIEPERHNLIFSDREVRRWYGESSTTYSIWEPALKRIRRCLHQPRFIVLLRHPVERLVSHYRWLWAKNLESRPFLQAVREEEQKGFHPDAPLPGGNYACYRRESHYSYFCPLMEQLFGRENILYLNSDELSKDHQGALNKCFRFLSLSEYPVGREIRENPTAGTLIQRTLGLKTLLKRFPHSFLDRMDPSSRMRAWVRGMLGQKKRRLPKISPGDIAKVTHMLKEDILFYQCLFEVTRADAEAEIFASS